MADSGISAIDRVFDLIDSSVEKIDHVLNRGKHTGEKLDARRSKGRVEVDTSSSVRVKSNAAPSKPTLALAKPSFRLIEAIDAQSGKTVFVVTDGKLAKVECTTRELAEKILRALEAA